ncbi:MAG TPA: hypothetical protein VFB72_02205 [Verrucomicrobiae bacterium]|nr:hypothetical protein [Verrucomicrobiae bacterium]
MACSATVLLKRDIQHYQKQFEKRQNSGAILKGDGFAMNADAKGSKKPHFVSGDAGLHHFFHHLGQFMSYAACHHEAMIKSKNLRRDRRFNQPGRNEPFDLLRFLAGIFTFLSDICAPGFRVLRIFCRVVPPCTALYRICR